MVRGGVSVGVAGVGAGWAGVLGSVEECRGGVGRGLVWAGAAARSGGGRLVNLLFKYWVIVALSCSSNMCCKISPLGSVRLAPLLQMLHA